LYVDRKSKGMHEAIREATREVTRETIRETTAFLSLYGIGIYLYF
jgi:hypothetical protein